MTGRKPAPPAACVRPCARWGQHRQVDQVARARHWSGAFGKAVGGWTAAITAACWPFRRRSGLAGTARAVLGDKAFDGRGQARSPAFRRPCAEGDPQPAEPVSFRPNAVGVPGAWSICRVAPPARWGRPATIRSRQSVPAVFQPLLEKAGFSVVYPDNLGGLCCGQPWDTKGLKDVADSKAAELEAAPPAASEGGSLPIVSDTSTCSVRLKDYSGPLEMRDVVDFLHDEVLPKLTVRQRQDGHAASELRRPQVGFGGQAAGLAQACAETVVQPEGILAADLPGPPGLTTPELNEYAIAPVARAGAGRLPGWLFLEPHLRDRVGRSGRDPLSLDRPSGGESHRNLMMACKDPTLFGDDSDVNGLSLAKLPRPARKGATPSASRVSSFFSNGRTRQPALWPASRRRLRRLRGGRRQRDWFVVTSLVQPPGGWPCVARLRRALGGETFG